MTRARGEIPRTRLLYYIAFWIFRHVGNANRKSRLVFSRAMIISIYSFNTLQNEPTFVPYYVRSPSNSHFLTFSFQLVPPRKHWRMILISKQGYHAASSGNCSNCFHRSSEPPIGFAGRKASHPPDSIASPQHSRSRQSFVVCLEEAFHLAYLKACSSVGYRLASMQLPEVMLRLCLVFHPMIPPTQLPRSRGSIHEPPHHLRKGRRSSSVARLPAWASLSLNPGPGVVLQERWSQFHRTIARSLASCEAAEVLGFVCGLPGFIFDKGGCQNTP